VNPADPHSERRSSPSDSRNELVLDKPAEGKGRVEPEPRYLDVPQQRRRSAGGRNLILGVLTLLIALALLVQAVALLGGRAAIPLATALLTLVTLFVLTRSRVLRHRNGGFLTLAVVCLLAALIPLAEYGGKLLADRGRGPTVQPASSSSTVNSATAREELPLLTQAYKIPTPEQNAARFKVLRDLRVVIDDKAHLIKAGEILPLGETGDGEVRFTAGNQQIALPMTFVEMLNTGTNGSNPPAQSAGDQPQIAATATPPASAPATDPASAAANPGTPQDAVMPQDETPSQVTQRAQKEAIRRYPALGQKDSPENQLFIETFQELKHSGADDFFADPQWPIQLAELLAKREGWERQP
jgi:hypothetical protein